MNYMFGLSLGCVHTFMECKNKNDIITFYRENFQKKINAIEITIPESVLKDFKLSKINYDWIRSLKHVSFHLLKTSHSYNKIYQCVKDNRLKVHSFICHIDNKKKLPHFFLEEYGNRILYENIEKGKNNFDGVKNCCFDVSHALYQGEFELEYTYYTNVTNIKQIHLSNAKNEKCHTLFYSDKHNNLNEMKEYINFKGYPVILESVCNCLEELRNEIKYIKENIYAKTSC